MRKVKSIGVPPLAGVASYEEASKPGYSVEQNVDLLRRYNYLETRLVEVAAAYICPTPEWEVKCALSLHVWLDAEHSAAIRKRVAEMREPPLHLDRCPDQRLAALMDEVIRPHDTIELLAGIFTVLRPALAEAYRLHMEATNRLIDYPTVRLLRFALLEEEDMIAWGRAALDGLVVTEEDRQRCKAWQDHISATWRLPAASWAPIPSQRRPCPSPVQPGPSSLIWCHSATPASPTSATSAPLSTGSGWTRHASPTSASGRCCSSACARWMFPNGWRPFWCRPRQTVGLLPRTGAPDLGRGAPFDDGRGGVHSPRPGLDGHAGADHRLLQHEPVPEPARASRPPVRHRAAADEARIPARLPSWRCPFGRRPAGHDFQDYDWADEVLHAQIGRRWLVPEIGSIPKILEMVEAARASSVEGLGYIPVGLARAARLVARVLRPRRAGGRDKCWRPAARGGQSAGGRASGGRAGGYNKSRLVSVRALHQPGTAKELPMSHAAVLRHGLFG